MLVSVFIGFAWCIYDSGHIGFHCKPIDAKNSKIILTVGATKNDNSGVGGRAYRSTQCGGMVLSEKIRLTLFIV